ncbi:MAG: Hpt domain-containing protein, partial [Candidatus Latescibacteria bacterium]|nr:Hpt domain-containing protein [Candidatus Latescibacterota bacterium]
ALAGIAVRPPPLEAAASPEEEYPGPLDPAVVANLQAWEREGYLSLAEFSQVFAEDAGRRLAALQQAVGDGDGARVKQEAHALKGASRELGAGWLASLCGRVEELGSAGSLDQVEVWLDAVRSEVTRVNAALAQLQAVAP